MATAVLDSSEPTGTRQVRVLPSQHWNPSKHSWPAVRHAPHAAFSEMYWGKLQLHLPRHHRVHVQVKSACKLWPALSCAGPHLVLVQA